MNVVAALDVGGTEIKGAVVTRAGELLHLERRATPRHEGQAHLVAAILAFAGDLVKTGQATHGPTAVAGVGLAVAGLVDEARGIATSSLILGWRDVPFVELLTQQVGLPVGFGHDVRVAAKAEQQMGAAQGCCDYLYLTLGTGVGSAFVLGGAPYLGARGRGGEVAHLVVEPEGPLCRCGKRGCLEMVASADAIARRYGDLAADGTPVTAHEVAERVAAGEPAATGVWNRAVAGLGQAIASYVETMDPERVVIGGGLTAAGPVLFDPLVACVTEGVRWGVLPPIVPAHLGPLAGVHGAACQAWEACDARAARESHGSAQADGYATGSAHVDREVRPEQSSRSRR